MYLPIFILSHKWVKILFKSGIISVNAHNFDSLVVFCRLFTISNCDFSLHGQKCKRFVLVQDGFLSLVMWIKFNFHFSSWSCKIESPIKDLNVTLLKSKPSICGSFKNKYIFCNNIDNGSCIWNSSIIEQQLWWSWIKYENSLQHLEMEEHGQNSTSKLLSLEVTNIFKNLILHFSCIISINNLFLTIW